MEIKEKIYRILESYGFTVVKKIRRLHRTDELKWLLFAEHPMYGKEIPVGSIYTLEELKVLSKFYQLKLNKLQTSCWEFYLHLPNCRKCKYKKWVKDNKIKVEGDN